MVFTTISTAKGVVQCSCRGLRSYEHFAFEVFDGSLTHSDIPEEDRYWNATVVEKTERGWRDLIFQRIRAVFGFGI
ncbi:hypothetical protein L3X38_038357 [Prunus dulcis]|uniref:Uncharacterized protein n=1 Tax=Prunus dulcis TaxID=3755 RepID=A0AAD4V6A9_PRUDU|nr:hypothetical protein L3X38_038357 [Prunus dulcis]